MQREELRSGQRESRMSVRGDGSAALAKGEARSNSGGVHAGDPEGQLQE